MTATPAPALTAAEQQTVDRFGIFEPEEREAALVATVARALWDACKGEGSHLSWDDRRVSGLYKGRYRTYAAAAIAAYRAAQDGAAEEAVRRVRHLAEGWINDAHRQGEATDLHFAGVMARAALATQAGDGGR